MVQERFENYKQELRPLNTPLSNGLIHASAWAPWIRSKPRVVALHLEQDNSFGTPKEYTEAEALRSYLQERSQTDKSSRRCVYILEGLSHDVNEVLRQHFRLPNTIFSDHERLIALAGRNTGEGGGLPFLPSAINGRDYVTLKYHEPLILSRPPKDFRNLCETTGRHIAVTRLMNEFSDVVISRRKCTFWSRTIEPGSWECLIICDPPLKRILTDYSGRAGYQVMTSPYNSGYLDFVPHEYQVKCGNGPPRTSFLDDMIFYLRSHTATLDLSNPNALRIFMEQIVAGNYLKVAEFLQSTIDVVQWSLSRRQNLTSFAISAAEEQWSDIQAWGRRIAEYQDDLEGIMVQLQIQPKTSTPSEMQGWKDCTPDYQFLRLRYKEIGRRTSVLNDSISALAGLVGNRQAFKAQELSLQAAERANREAKSVKVLTLLGVIFIPLGYVASLFSMSAPYGPGGEKFWLYFPISGSLLSIIVVSYFLLELRSKLIGAI